jgi:hypothetical protein
MNEESIGKVEQVRHTFSTQERFVLVNLAEQILELLGQSSVSHDPLHDLVGISGNELPPDDPVLKRLLPSAYQELQDAAEFRRYTEDSLRDKKRAHAYRVREMLLDGDTPEVLIHGENEVESSALKLIIEGEDIWAWLGALNDIRLALAVRLDIGGPTMGDLPNDQHRADQKTPKESSSSSSSSNEDFHRRYELMAESDPMKAVYAVYSWLGWLQENFLRQIDPDEIDPDALDPTSSSNP